ncbi:hypothetical protein SLA2020_025750 [Shorea laevis]
MMWGFASNAIASIGLKKNLVEANRACSDCSDDEVGSNVSREEGLECPICWESFNIVENVPYVLWCGYTLCQNCVLGLQSVVLKFPAQEIKFHSSSPAHRATCYHYSWCIEETSSSLRRIDSFSG